MNHIKNDYGEDILAIGAPGSIERTNSQYPKLLNGISECFLNSNFSVKTKSVLECESIISCIRFLLLGKY